MALLVNDPDRQELGILNRVINNYCANNESSDYIAEQVIRNIYCIEVNIAGSTNLKLVNELGFKLNIITE